MTPLPPSRIYPVVLACVLCAGALAATVDWKNGRPGTVVMPSPPAALDVPLKEPTNAPFSKLDTALSAQLARGSNLLRSASRSLEAGTNLLRAMDRLIGTTNTAPPMPVAPMPSFSDGVRIASALFSRNPDFDKLFTPQEKVAMCARVWELERKGAK